MLTPQTKHMVNLSNKIMHMDKLGRGLPVLYGGFYSLAKDCPQYSRQPCMPVGRSYKLCVSHQ